jgi:hypothetical protein
MHQVWLPQRLIDHTIAWGRELSLHSVQVAMAEHRVVCMFEQKKYAEIDDERVLELDGDLFLHQNLLRVLAVAHGTFGITFIATMSQVCSFRQRQARAKAPKFSA